MYITDHICHQCHKEFRGGDKEFLCPSCEASRLKEEMEKFLKDWRGNLTIEERVAKIEEWIFMFSKHEHFDPMRAIF